MLPEEKKTAIRTDNIVTLGICTLGLLFCCYCGIFVFPWGANKLVIAFGITFLSIVMFFLFARWFPVWKVKYNWVFIFVLAITAVAGIFGIAKLRAYYAESQLNKYGVTAMGEVVGLFKERRGRYGTNKVDMAKIAFRAGNDMVYNDVENKNKYMGKRDRMKLVYSTKNPHIFQIVGHYKAEEQRKADNPVPANVTFIDTPPMFPGDMPALYAYLRDHVEYPKQAKDQGISGKVFISFVITEDGSVTDIKVEKGIGGGCDEAAVKAVADMPRWRPGRQNGKSVRVKYNIPISFSR